MILTKAFVIHSIKFKEYDRIYTLFTEEFGKIQARGRGVRKIRSKMGPHLQALNIVKVNLSEGKIWYTITGVAQGENIFSLSNFNEDKFKMNSYICEVLKKTLPEEQEQKELFTELETVFKKISDLPLYLAKSVFLLQYMKFTGHNIELYECLKCGVKDTDFSFKIEDNGIVCKKCSPYSNIINPEYLKYLKIIEDENLEYIDRLKDLSKPVLDSINTLIETLFFQNYTVKINTII